MRNLLSNISNIVRDVIVRRGNKLIVGVEVLRSLCADLSAALSYYASRVSLEISDVLWHLPMDLRGMKPRVHAARCFVTVKQRQWGHNLTCRRDVA